MSYSDPPPLPIPPDLLSHIKIDAETVLHLDTEVSHININEFIRMNRHEKETFHKSRTSLSPNDLHEIYSYILHQHTI